MEKTCEDCDKVVEREESYFKSKLYLFWGETISSRFTCYECYAAKWDAGFESSMEYSDMMFRREEEEKNPE